MPAVGAGGPPRSTKRSAASAIAIRLGGARAMRAPRRRRSSPGRRRILGCSARRRESRGWSRRRRQKSARALRRAAAAPARGRRQGDRSWRAANRSTGGTTVARSRRRASTRTPSPSPARQAASARASAGSRRRILRIEPRLDRVAAAARLCLRERQRLGPARPATAAAPGRARSRLGHGVLDLDARVHLQEVEAAVVVEQELDRAGADVADRRAPPARAASRMRRAQLGRDAGDGASSISFWWRRWIEQSRSPRWTIVPCSSPNTWTSTWRGAEQRALDQETARRRRRSPPRRAADERRRQLLRLAHEPHAAPAAAGARLDHDGIADPPGLLGEARRALVFAMVSGRARHARRRACAPWPRLLSPMARMPTGGGPTKTRPAAAQASAKSALSARKP